MLLSLAFRSLLIPLTGALTSLGSMLAGLTKITAIFQLAGDGPCSESVGRADLLRHPGVIVGVVFGLSTDYQVFLLSRIRENGVAPDDARAVGSSSPRPRVSS